MIFGTVRLKVFHGKSLNSYFVHSFFGCPNFFESLEVSPQIFWHCETKTIDRIVLPYYPKVSRYQKISKTQGSPYEIFRYCETKTIDRIVIPLLSETFWYQNIPETQTGWVPLRIFLAMWDKKKTKLWYPYYLKTFDIRTFLKHMRVRPRCFSAIWDQKISTEKRDTPLLSKNLFRTRNFVKDKNVPPRCFSVL